jgi:uncharacterized protein (TIGR02594 family)
MERRTFLKAGMTATLSGVVQTASAQPVAAPLDDYKDISVPFPADYRLYGTNPATGAEEDKARKILDACKPSQTLVATAQYFENLTDVNNDGYQYNAQWPDVQGGRWNPVLIGFYQSTTLGENYVYRHGDTIDWCAAFINWCLIRSGYKPTKSAMSGSFRTYGVARKPGETAVVGDLLVLRKAGKSGDAGHGHVTIYMGETSTHYRGLGGNQKAGKKFSSVNTTTIPKDDPKRIFHSIRSIETMRA